MPILLICFCFAITVVLPYSAVAQQHTVLPVQSATIQQQETSPLRLTEATVEHAIAESEEDTWKAEIHAVVNPHDSANIVAATMASSPTGQQIIVYTSLDFGATWQQTTNIINSFDPMLTIDSDGTWYFFYFLTSFPTPFDPNKIETHLHYRYSTDKGKTWQLPTKDRISKESYDDKEWAAADNTSSPYKGTVYVALASFVNSLSNTTGNSIVLYSKSPGSTSFSAEPVRITSSDFATVHTPSIGIAPDGTLHATFMGAKAKDTPMSCWHTMSTDGGKTFSEAVEIMHIAISANEAYSLTDSPLRIPGFLAFPNALLTVSPKDGSLHLVWHDIVRQNDQAVASHIYYTQSTDKGATWSTPRRLNNNQEIEGYYHYSPSMAINSNGVICASWYDGGTAKNSTKVHTATTYSFDNGTSFVPSIIATEQPANLSELEQKQKFFFSVGHYTQLLCTNGYVIPFWSDGRTGKALDLYCAFVPIGTNTTSVERVVRMSQSKATLAITPNPIADNSTITLALDAPAHVELRIIDITGKTVLILLDEHCPMGETHAHLEAALLAPGMYVCSAYTNGVLAVSQQVTIQR